MAEQYRVIPKSDKDEGAEPTQGPTRRGGRALEPG